MGTYWKCKNCGKINMDYVGTCACGGLKSDGEAATEEEYKNQVPEKDIPQNMPMCLNILPFANWQKSWMIRHPQKARKAIMSFLITTITGSRASSAEMWKRMQTGSPRKNLEIS